MSGTRNTQTPDRNDLVLFATVAYALTGMWLVPNGDKYVPAIILITLFYFIASKLWATSGRVAANPKLPFALAVSAAALICGLGYVTKDGNISELRTLTALAVFSGMSVFMTLNERLWLITVIVSGAAFIAVSFYQFFLGDMPRAHLHYNPIPFATGLATVLVSALFLAMTSSSVVKLIAWTTTLLLFAALAMTGTRGVALPVVLILGLSVVYLLYRQASSSKLVLAGGGLMLILAIATGGHLLESRINDTVAEIDLIGSGNKTSSIGLRLQFWEAALSMSMIEPVTGLGETHKSVFQNLAKQGVVDQSAADYAPYHYHNQFLDILVKRGIPGLLALLAVLITPTIIAFRYFYNNKLVLGSICGITFMYSVASLTDVPFNHPVTINLFVLSILSLLSLKPDSSEQLRNNSGVTT